MSFSLPGPEEYDDFEPDRPDPPPPPRWVYALFLLEAGIIVLLIWLVLA